jgi:hypothetical protein
MSHNMLQSDAGKVRLKGVMEGPENICAKMPVLYVNQRNGRGKTADTLLFHVQLGAAARIPGTLYVT